MPYAIDALTADCYEGTDCLINKMGIRDAKLLAEVESEITLAKTVLLLDHPIGGRFDFAHYKAIHRFLFEDLYDWAGTIRTVDMSKKGTLFAKAAEIDSMATAIFQRLHAMNCFSGLSVDRFAEELVDFYCTTNHLHPFREGNGRTQRLFLHELAGSAGYEIRFKDMDPDELMIATIYAAGGVTDQLLRLFCRYITKK